MINLALDNMDDTHWYNDYPIAIVSAFKFESNSTAVNNALPHCQEAKVTAETTSSYLNSLVAFVSEIDIDSEYKRNNNCLTLESELLRLKINVLREVTKTFNARLYHTQLQNYYNPYEPSYIGYRLFIPPYIRDLNVQCFPAQLALKDPALRFTISTSKYEDSEIVILKPFEHLEIKLVFRFDTWQPDVFETISIKISNWVDIYSQLHEHLLDALKLKHFHDKETDNYDSILIYVASHITLRTLSEHIHCYSDRSNYKRFILGDPSNPEEYAKKFTPSHCDYWFNAYSKHTSTWNASGAIFEFQYKNKITGDIGIFSMHYDAKIRLYDPESLGSAESGSSSLE